MGRQLTRRVTLRTGAIAVLVVLAAATAGTLLYRDVPDPGVAVVRPPPSPCSLFASPAGSEQGNGDAAHPFRTVQKLVRSLLPGQTGCLRNGTYRGDVELTRDRTTLRSAPGERATLSPATLTVPAGADGVTVSDLDIVGATDSLTVRVIGDHFTLERDDVTNSNEGKTCVLVGASDHRTVGGSLRENVIHGCGQVGNPLHHGIYAQSVGPPAAGGTGLLIEGNVLYDIAAYAVQLYPKAPATVVRHNVIDGGGLSVRGGIVIDGPVSGGDLIEGNVIARTKTGAVVQRTGSGHLSRGNCLWGNARGIDGSGITSVSDRVSDDCWLSREVWAATGRDAAQARGTRPRTGTGCTAAKGDALCRLLTRHESEKLR